MNLAVINAELLPEATRNALDVLTHSLNTIGEWKDQPFDATHFRGGGTMVWTVTGADVGVFRYMVMGRTLFLNLFTDTTTISGTATTYVQVRLPGGYTAAQVSLHPFHQVQAGTGTVSVCQTTPGDPYLKLYKDASGSGNWSAGTDDTSVRVSIAIEVMG